MATLALCSGIACKDKGHDATEAVTVAPATTASAASLDAQCARLGKSCGDTDKHVEKIVDECRKVAKTQVEKGCTDLTLALSDCYARELCGKADKVWAFGDLPVLSKRTNKCIAEQAAVDACVAK